MKTRNYLNLFNISVKNKKTTVHLNKTKKNKLMLNYLLKNNLIKNISDNHVYLSFYKNTPKFKNISICKNNERKYYIK